MAGGYKQIKPEDNPKPFKKGNKANPNGRPRKLIGTVNKELEESGVKEATKQEITSCYLRLMNLEIEELEEKVSDNSQPALIRIVSKNILSGKGFDIIEKMLDRGIGKAEQSIDHTTKGESINIINLGNGTKPDE